ncbi:MAG: hypothetical protein Q8K32_16695 [Archangium sp.]|nr:hypothetical protein [Archangium sp.]
MLFAAVALRSWDLFGVLLVGGAVGLVALVPLIIGLVLLPVQLAKRRAFDAKVKHGGRTESAFQGDCEGTVIATF